MEHRFPLQGLRDGTGGKAGGVAGSQDAGLGTNVSILVVTLNFEFEFYKRLPLGKMVKGIQLFRINTHESVSQKLNFKNGKMIIF